MSFLPPRKPLPDETEDDETQESQDSAPRTPVPVGHTYVRPEPDEDSPSVYDASVNGNGAANDPWTYDPLAFEPVEERRSSFRVKKLAWELVQTLFLAALIFLAVRAMAQNFKVEGSSMEPGLHDGQYLLVNKAVYFKLDTKALSKWLPFINGSSDKYLFHGPQRGDVVVFRFPQDPSRDFIKRVIAVPGDTVAISKGVVSVNGVTLNEPYILDPGAYDMAQETVPAGNYFVLGDNRNNSYDSHAWGYVPEQNIIGQAVFSYWPFDEFGGVGNTDIKLGALRIPLPW